MKGPKALHPAFYGCYDWHSSVHGHWMLARLVRLFPDLPEAGQIRSMLKDHLTAEKLKAEADYFARKDSKSFERPYGWAWLLKLAEELHTWDDPDAREWSKNKPLVNAIIADTSTSSPSRRTPSGPACTPTPRSGWPSPTTTPAPSATRGCKAWSRSGAGLLRRGRDMPAKWEPSGADFFSPSLMEADLMRRVLPPTEFRPWFARFLPGAAKGEPDSLFTPATVTDRTDPQLVHLDGLNRAGRGACGASRRRCRPATRCGRS